ncbi:RHS repeat-associated core domain-containing protein, partial [Acetivibrio sp. MSJd-27]|uniref:RHS repeat-associated core domain-containing protein n=1 Tax=Acetivibrio sp. MSJd-27 TaxID=2841523 RepID=UPI001C11DB8C
KQVSDSSGTTNYTYDGLGQLLKETKGGVVKDYTYDANGNRKSFKLTNSGTIELNTTYAYDIQNRLISVTNDGETTSYSYDNNGNLLSTTGAVNTQYTYNQANLMTAQTNRLGENVLGQYSVSYYLDGNKESIAESGKPTTSYLYDDMGRLPQEVIAGESQTIYQYDSFLNRSRKVEKDASGNVIKTNTYQYNKNNWLLEDRETAGEGQTVRNFFYDNMGNQTMKTITTIGEATGEPSVTIGEDPNGIQLFEYDPLNRMTKATINNVTTTYTYDANGLRQSKSTNGVTTSHIYDGQNIVMDDKAGEKQVFVRGLSPISRTVNEGGKEYYSFNTHGDTAQLLSASGTVLKDYTYDAFGNQKQEQAEDNNPFRYCGEYFDNETGFIYLRARYYDSSIGRFISEDPAKDGTNWYSYCTGNPVNKIDPNGLTDVLLREMVEKLGGTVTPNQHNIMGFKYGLKSITVELNGKIKTYTSADYTINSSDRSVVNDQMILNDFFGDVGSGTDMNASKEQMKNYIVQSAWNRGVPVDLALATAMTESSINQILPSTGRVDNGGGDYGVMQINSVHFDKGSKTTVNGKDIVNNWQNNVDYGIDYLSKCYNEAVSYGYTGDDLLKATYSNYNSGSCSGYRKNAEVCAHVNNFWRVYTNKEWQ